MGLVISTTSLWIKYFSVERFADMGRFALVFRGGDRVLPFLAFDCGQ